MNSGFFFFLYGKRKVLLLFFFFSLICSRWTCVATGSAAGSSHCATWYAPLVYIFFCRFIVCSYWLFQSFFFRLSKNCSIHFCFRISAQFLWGNLKKVEAKRAMLRVFFFFHKKNAHELRAVNNALQLLPHRNNNNKKKKQTSTEHVARSPQSLTVQFCSPSHTSFTLFFPLFSSLFLEHFLSLMTFLYIVVSTTCFTFAKSQTKRSNCFFRRLLFRFR